MNDRQANQTKRIDANAGVRILTAGMALALLTLVGAWNLDSLRAGTRELVQDCKRLRECQVAPCYLTKESDERLIIGRPTYPLQAGTRGGRLHESKEDAGKGDAKPASVTFRDIDGRTQTPLAQPDKKATVLFFIIPNCPIVNASAPEIQRIGKDFESKKVAAFLVYADPDVTVQQAKKHRKEYGLTFPALIDPTHVLVKKTGVTIAPEVAVLDPAEQVVYRGRIDDLYVDYGKRRPEPTQRDLRRALDEILQGKAVSTPTTKAIGCFLPEPKKS
jgi:peroxiredoxin